MKKLFYLGALFLILFEILTIYFIMPLPGSQEMNSIETAYFLYSYRWIFRIVFGTMILVGFYKSWNTQRKWIRILVLIVIAIVVYLTNFVMVADKMFLQPSQLIMQTVDQNDIALDRLVIGIEYNGEAKAYPIEFLAYHHQVRDSISGKPVIVTYCSVCRTGRVFEPLVNGQVEKFRLVGMDHFNAMFEDETTGSWWRQATGEAITGSMKGIVLPEFESFQMSLQQWISLYPNSLIMQEDPNFSKFYDPEAKFEKGLDKSNLTGTDLESWNKKSWVVGIKIGTASKAYDWNTLVTHKVINDKIGDTPIVLTLADDNTSFMAFERPTDALFTKKGDTLYSCDKKYNLSGENYFDKSDKLKRIAAYQEFWHSWKTFHPETVIFE